MRTRYANPIKTRYDVQPLFHLVARSYSLVWGNKRGPQNEPTSGLATPTSDQLAFKLHTRLCDEVFFEFRRQFSDQLWDQIWMNFQIRHENERKARLKARHEDKIRNATE